MNGGKAGLSNSVVTNPSCYCIASTIACFTIETRGRVWIRINYITKDRLNGKIQLLWILRCLQFQLKQCTMLQREVEEDKWLHYLFNTYQYRGRNNGKRDLLGDSNLVTWYLIQNTNNSTHWNHSVSDEWLDHSEKHSFDCELISNCYTCCSSGCYLSAGVTWWIALMAFILVFIPIFGHASILSESLFSIYPQPSFSN